MFQQWRRRRGAKRVVTGDGSALPPFRWWQLLSRSLFRLELADTTGRTVPYDVEVRPWRTDEDGYVEARLYRNGTQHAASRVPAFFVVEGGTIEVDTSSVGLRRCHYVTDDGVEHQLTPDAQSAEGRRARFERQHPLLSRAVGAVSIVMLLVAVALMLQQIAVPILQVPPIVDRIGLVEPLVQLPLWQTLALTVAAVAASTERALRLRYRWFLDGAGT